MSTVLPFPAPRTSRSPNDEKPADAIPVGRPRTVYVSPVSSTGWEALLVDDGGGMTLVTDATKLDALRAALPYVFHQNAELILRNFGYGEGLA